MENIQLNHHRSVVFCVVRWIITVWTWWAVVDGRVFKIGYMTGAQDDPDDPYMPYAKLGYRISGAISAAVNDVNRLHPNNLLLNHSLDFQYIETYGSPWNSINITGQLCANNSSDVIIGPQRTCLDEAAIAAEYKMLMLSYECEDFRSNVSLLSWTLPNGTTPEKSTFVLVKPQEHDIANSVASFLLAYNWRKVAFLYTVEDTDWEQTSEAIMSVLEQSGIQILSSRIWNKHIYLGATRNAILPFTQMVHEIKNVSRVVVIVGYIDSHVAFMRAMEEEGILDSGDYFVVGVYLERYQPDDPLRYVRGMYEDDPSNTTDKVFASFVGIAPSPIPSALHTEFTTTVNENTEKPPFGFEVHPFLRTKKIMDEAFHLYDTIMIYARAVNECLANATDCPNPRDGSVLIKYILDRPFPSAMGFASYVDNKGIAHGNYSLLALRKIAKASERNVRSVAGVSESYGLADIGLFQLNERVPGGIPKLVFKQNETLRFPLGRTPTDEPSCGFDGRKCEKSSKWALILTITTILILVTLIVIAGLLVYRHRQRTQEAAKMRWKIEYDQLNVERMQGYLKGMLDHDGTLGHDGADVCASSQSLTSVAHLLDAVFTEIRIPNNLQTEIGFYNNEVVCVARLKKTPTVLTSTALKELKTAYNLHNENICKFIGASVDPACIVTEFCSRGSLIDILYDETLVLDSLFMESMIGDIVRGMCYLHSSPIKSHGNLKPTNCLVDSRFTVKLTGYGLHEFRRGVSSYNPLYELCEFRQHFDRLLWTAPELLRDAHRPPAGTPAGDVYSFSLILYEIYVREPPFERLRLTSTDIVAMLRSTEEKPLRPKPADLIETSHVPDYVVNVMVDCWNEEPAARPDFQTVKKRLKVKPTVMDNVVGLLQRYSNNLQDLVTERTKALQEEKCKTEALLHEILPRPVAEQLIMHGKYEAEQYESVTVFFSDLVGFTAMSAESTPFEVVTFLNDLYTLFDSLLEHYDAYKVETIGDSYMVCSGLPIRNGNAHAGVIASMSLHLMEVIKHFRIQHRPSEPLLLRIGIHSGPVVAGVVGRKMPRYCLFGDTVNTASRYESRGLAQKIHCSPQCKGILDSLGGYQLELRGTVSLKGKGDVLTYWLTDEDAVRKASRKSVNIATLNTQNTSAPLLLGWGPLLRISQMKRRFDRRKKTKSTGSSLRSSITSPSQQGDIINEET